MATRIYKDPADFDLNQAHFTIETVNSQYYLRIGALNSEDQRLIGSLIDDGFVGFFQDDVRIGIAGIVSTYDAENDRIEINRELPELKIEDEYVIRFTQARPGEDGEGGIGTPGDDGDDGWSPKFATVPDGERRVLQVADWFGGGGTKPDTGQYIGATGFVATIGEGVDIRGPAGEDGEDADLSHLVVNTRGVLIATSSFLPKFSGNSDRVLDNIIQWTLNTDSGYVVSGIPKDHSPEAHADFIRTFNRGTGVGATGGLGVLNVPYKKPEATVNGLWLVCEDLTDPDIEVWEVFIPWGGGSLEDDKNPTYFDSRYILHWGREGNSNTVDGADVTVYFSKTRSYNFKSQIRIKSYRNEKMPSTQCRVKVYLAGVFLTVPETE